MTINPKTDPSSDWTAKHPKVLGDPVEDCMVERIGFEPMTLCLQSRCSTN